MYRLLADRPGLVLLAFTLLAVLAYVPGLGGAFIYDDFVFVVDNLAVHVRTGRLADWIAAADSFPAPHQGRWLGMLSFAANYYFHGLNPYGYKLANLAIHLINGWIVWRMLRALLRLKANAAPGPKDSEDRLSLAALLIAAVWLILPINLTSVLYVSQRLESLSNTFVLLGLWGYLVLRNRDWLGKDTGLRIVLTVMVCGGIGSLIKESAVLLPLYVACIDLILTGFKRRDGSWSRAMLICVGICLILPLLIGLIWLASWIGGEHSYARSYDTTERLLTQGRVLVSYIRWTLAPDLGELSLHHDDIQVSTSLFDPRSTLPALLVLALMLIGALTLRRRMPLLSVGVVLFFAGHSLTSTVIPLMLAFEHRNYFPSIGLLLAGASVLGLETNWLKPRVQAVVIALLYVFYLGTTHLRALEWSTPLRLVTSEASKRPDSVEAQYDLARTLISLAADDPHDPRADQALALLTSKRSLPGGGLLFDHALLILQARRGEVSDPAVWDSMVAAMRKNPPLSRDRSAVIALYDCMQSGVCAPQYAQLRQVIEATFAHPKAEGDWYSIHAVLMYRQLGDPLAATQSFAEALRRSPHNASIQFNRALMLIEIGELEQARHAIDELKEHDRLGTASQFIKQLEERLAQANGR